MESEEVDVGRAVDYVGRDLVVVGWRSVRSGRSSTTWVQMCEDAGFVNTKVLETAEIDDVDTSVGMFFASKRSDEELGIG